MAKIKGLKLSQQEVSQTINLQEEFGVDLSTNQGIKLQIGQAIIDRILERTESNKGVHGKNLKRPYSKSYRNSREFELYGKSPNDVNMKLKGDMLNSLDVEDRGNNLTIKVSEGEAPKAYNHNVGDTLPKRPWFGINKKELNEIKREFKNEIQRLKEEGQEETQEQERLDLATLRALAQERQSQSALDELIGGLFGESDL